jgi:hypothetical protein
MPTKSKPPPKPKKSDTVESIMGSLTKELVAAIPDQGTKEAVEALRVRALGIATVLLSNDKILMVHAEKMTKKGASLEHARQLVAEANALLQLRADRLAKDAAHKAAVAAESTGRDHAHEAANEATNLLRFIFGNTAAELSEFGVTPMGNQSGTHKPKAKPAAADEKPKT